MISIQTAYQLISEHVLPLAKIEVGLPDAVGRVLQQDIVADVDSPPHRKSVMDGFAVRSSDINAGLRRLKIVESIVAGQWPKRSIESGESARIMTGAPVPDGADAIVMVEMARANVADEQEWVEINADSIVRGKHLMETATNFARGDVVFQAGHRVRPSDIGLLAEVGAAKVLTCEQPTAAFLPTGDELVTCNQIPAMGQIRNSNGPMLLAMGQQLDLETADLGIGRDNETDLRFAIGKGLERDLFVLSGGVSAGTADLVPKILQESGVEEVFHKVLVKPGKPIWFGTLDQQGRRCCVFGLPGNPVSSLVGFHLFVRTAIRIMQGDRHCQPAKQLAILTEDHETRGDRPTYWPGRRVQDESTIRKVKPLAWNGSSDLLALGAAEGLIFFAAGSANHPAGTEVSFYPFGNI